MEGKKAILQDSVFVYRLLGQFLIPYYRDKRPKMNLMTPLEVMNRLISAHSLLFISHAEIQNFMQKVRENRFIRV